MDGPDFANRPSRPSRLAPSFNSCFRVRLHASESDSSVDVNLILDNNGLTGSIPAGLSNCSSLNWIPLSSNHLSGSIPSWIGRLGNLAILKLGNNSFTGPIPPELGDRKSLIWLDLNNNHLNGGIPPALAEQSGNIAVSLVTGKRYVYLRNDGSSECRGSGNLLEFAEIRPGDLNRLPSRRLCNYTWVYKESDTAAEAPLSLLSSGKRQQLTQWHHLFSLSLSPLMKGINKGKAGIAYVRTCHPGFTRQRSSDATPRPLYSIIELL